MLVDEPPATDGAEAAERRVMDLADALAELVEIVEAPAALSDDFLPEQLSFLQARENFHCFVALTHDGRDVPAAHLARALFEESARWSWVDEDPDRRREAFLGYAARAYRLIADAAATQGIDQQPLFGRIVEERLLPATEGARRFPARFEELLDWTGPGVQEMLYLQYRVLSQYTHSSLLAAASTSEVSGPTVANRERLPLAARFMVIRNACASVGFVLDFCKEGLRWHERPGTPPLNVNAIGIAAAISGIAYPFSPGSA
jgi:hypothetical protein